MSLINVKTFPVLETERLRLRKVEMTDVDRFYEIFSNPVVMKDYGINPHETIADSEALIHGMQQGLENGKVIRWALTKKETNEYIGSSGFHQFNVAKTKAEIGFELHPDEWGKGYMKEAVQSILQYGFEELNLVRIEGIVHDDNENSKSLLRKLGFTYEGCLRKRFYGAGKLSDEHFFGMLKEEFLSN